MRKYPFLLLFFCVFLLKITCEFTYIRQLGKEFWITSLWKYGESLECASFKNEIRDVLLLNVFWNGSIKLFVSMKRFCLTVY